MLALFVRTNCVSWRKADVIVRLLCLSRSRNVIPLRLRLRFTGQLRQLFMFLVRPSGWRLSKGKGWPSRCSPGLKRSPSWPGNTRSAGSSSINRFTPPRRLSAQPRTLKSTRRRPLVPTGHQSLAAATGPGLVFICHSSTRGVVELLHNLFDYRISLGTVHNIVHSPVAHARRINEQYDLSTIRIGLLDEIFQAADPVFVGSMPPRPSASC